MIKIDIVILTTTFPTWVLYYLYYLFNIDIEWLRLLIKWIKVLKLVEHQKPCFDFFEILEPLVRKECKALSPIPYSFHCHVTSYLCPLRTRQLLFPAFWRRNHLIIELQSSPTILYSRTLAHTPHLGQSSQPHPDLLSNCQLSLMTVVLLLNPLCPLHLLFNHNQSLALCFSYCSVPPTAASLPLYLEVWLCSTCALFGGNVNWCSHTGEQYGVSSRN